MKTIKIHSVPTATLPVVVLQPRTAGQALARALGLTGFVEGFPPSLSAEAAAADAAIAEAPCPVCGAEGTGRALPLHQPATGRYRLLVVHECCVLVGEP